MKSEKGWKKVLQQKDAADNNPLCPACGYPKVYYTFECDNCGYHGSR